MRRGGYVYFVQDEVTGLIKIGTTNHLRHRIQQLKSEGGRPVKLLGYIWGRFAKEREMHARFAAFRVQGEWFEPQPELLTFIATAINRGYPPVTQPDPSWLGLFTVVGVAFDFRRR